MLKHIFSGALLNFWLFLAFSCGIIFCAYFPSFLGYFFLLITAISLIIIFYKRQRFLFSDIFVLILFSSLGALWYLPHTSQNIDEFLGHENSFILKVSSLPKENVSKNIFFAEIKKINGAKVVQRVRVIDYTKKLDYLSSYEVRGKLSKNRFRNADFYTLWIKSASVPKKLAVSVWDMSTRKMTYQLLNILKNNLTNESYRFIASVFLGRRELLSQEEKTIFANAGISHLLAISGSNIGLTALVLFFILKLFNLKFRVCLLVSLFFLFFYTFITGATPPTLRAAIMYGVFSLSFLAKRKLNALSSLGLAGLTCLLVNPSWFFDVGFQLSFLSIFALILGFKFFPVRPFKQEFFNQLQYLFFSSLYVTILITPLVSYYFQRVYILSVLNNIILIPFFSIILIINFILLIFSPLNFIAQFIGEVMSILIPFFYKISQLLGSIKLSFIAYKFSPKVIFLYYLIIIAFIFYFKKQKEVNNALSLIMRKWFDKIRGF